MRWSSIPTFLVGLGLAVPALAESDAEQVNYRFEHQARVPSEVLAFEPMHTDQTLALRWRLDASCDVRSERGGRTLTCSVQRARLTSSDLAPLLDGIPQARTALELSVVSARLSRAGRLLEVDVRLPDGSPSPLVRFVVERSFAGFDLPIEDDTIWSQRDTLLVPQPGGLGGVAHVRALHFQAEEDGVPTIGTHGAISWMPRATIAEPGSTRSGEVRARATIDPDHGLVRERRWTTRIGEGEFEETGWIRTLAPGSV